MSKLLQTKDVAGLLGLTCEGVRALARRGVLRCERTPSGSRVYRRADVESLARTRRKGNQQTEQSGRQV